MTGGWERSVWTGQRGQVSRDKSAWTGQPGQVSLDRSGETGQPRQVSLGRSARTVFSFSIVMGLKPTSRVPNERYSTRGNRHVATQKPAVLFQNNPKKIGNKTGRSKNHKINFICSEDPHLETHDLIV